MQLASRTLMLSMAVTVLIGFAELIFWVFSRNNLFLIEGAGNLVWLVPDLIMLFTICVGSKKADLKMNFGYRRIETISLLFFALGITGFVIYIIYQTVTNASEQLPMEYGMITVVFSVVIVVILALLARYTWNVGKKIRSRLLMLDSMVIRLDIASAGILIISGFFLVIAPSVMIIQTVLTVLVGLALLVYSVNEVVQAAKELIDASPSLQVMNLIEQIAEETPEVIFVSEQRVRSFGGAISVEITIETDPEMTINDAYRIASDLEERIKLEVDNVIDVRVRMNPAGTYVKQETLGWDRHG
ncbi:MAG: cation diffusion facilitator family transporter [Methanomicrobiales archaeon]|nr:cation diffusion facilitator family transporter [Methanomicrobiales archaeon]